MIDKPTGAPAGAEPSKTHETPLGAYRPEWLDDVLAEMRALTVREADRYFDQGWPSTGGQMPSPNLGPKWERLPTESVHSVYIGRMIWTAAEIARRLPVRSSEFRTHATVGIELLSSHFLDGPMRDGEGGIWWAVDPSGRPIRAVPSPKHAYGAAFAIFGCAAAARTFGDSRALDIANKLFVWLERAGHDKAFGGYFESFGMEGRPHTRTDAGGEDAVGTPMGYKSHNTHLHLLEALTELDAAGGGERVRGRLSEVFGLFERWIGDKGWIPRYFERDWKPLPGPTSYGLNAEVAYLLTAAGDRLGGVAADRAVKMSDRLLTHTLKHGWDEASGALYDSGPHASGRAKLPLDRSRVWWIQVEFMHALAHAWVRNPEREELGEAIRRCWEFCRESLIDRSHGGWWWSVDGEGRRAGPGTEPGSPTVKGSNRKASYHTVRGLLGAWDLLRR